MRHPCARFWVQVHALIAISAIETHLRFWTQISGIRFIGLANIPHSDFSYASIISNYPGMLLVKAGSQFHLNFYSKLNHSIYLCFFLFNFNLIFFFFIFCFSHTIHLLQHSIDSIDILHSAFPFSVYLAFNI